MELSELTDNSIFILVGQYLHGLFNQFIFYDNRITVFIERFKTMK